MNGLQDPKDNARLALFFSSLRGAGIQRVMLNLAEGLLGMGRQVDLVLVKAEGELLPEVPQGVRLIDLKSARSLYALPRLMDYLRKEKPVCLLASQTHLNLAAIWARAFSRSPTRLILSEHIDLAASARNAANWKDRLAPLAARLFYRAADGLIVVSRSAADGLLRATGLPAGFVHVIHNPIVTPALLAQAESSVTHPWFQPGQPSVVLSVGRLTRQKDHETLLRAFAILRQKEEARLVILGEGEERPRLESLAFELGIQDDFRLPGYVSNPGAYMSRARVFVLSSRWEGFANVLVEALACGTPVVSTDCPSGPAEILENGRFGSLSPVADPSALAAGMLEVMQSPAPVESLKARAMDFSLDRITRQYLQVLMP
jgi:glycosyltransferase involved in cell wall biosynthesis